LFVGGATAAASAAVGTSPSPPWSGGAVWPSGASMSTTPQLKKRTKGKWKENKAAQKLLWDRRSTVERCNLRGLDFSVVIHRRVKEEE
jgi:hypothetical protein